MTEAIRIRTHGGPEVLSYETIALDSPGPGEAHVRHMAVGLNFADTYFRTGLYPAALPAGLGVEASGVVEAVGQGVNNVRRGSVFVTRPALADYISDPVERAELVGELFGHVASGRISIEINQRYRLAEAAQAHRDLEARVTTGSSIFDLTLN